MEPGFVKGSTENLPQVNFAMIDEYYVSNLDFLSAEVKNVKTKRSARETYGDNAVGYVQLKRDGASCTVRARITPEHRVHKRNYSVMVKIEEQLEKVLECKCLDCAASAGGCKHGVAFLMWMHRRSEEPSVTSQECYWKKSALSKAVKEAKIMDLQSLVDKPIPKLRQKNNNFLEKVKSIASEGGLFDFFKKTQFCNMSVYQLALKYKENTTSNSTAEDFIDFMKRNMTVEDCKLAELNTRGQSKSVAWYELRFGRITASRCYEASKCKTTDGALTEAIMGASRPLDTAPVKRGLALEIDVLNEVEKMRNLKIKRSGLILDKHFPLFGASPDGVTEEYCIEVKCPFMEKNMKHYVDENVVNDKFYAQMQMQMLFSKKTKGLFCIAAPDFENSKMVNIHEIVLDENYCHNLIEGAQLFWKSSIFPKLIDHL